MTKLKLFAITGLAAVLGSACLADGIALRQIKKEGWKTVEIENDFYKVVLIPKIARLPYSYLFKPTGHELFRHPVPLTTPKKGEKFIYYGGIIDSIPWVAGNVDSERLPTKGYLHFSKWTEKTGKSGNFVWWEGKTKFKYKDPITGVPARLSFKKRITGYAGSSQLRMDYTIKNTGKTDARLTLDIHARTIINEYSKGDYFYAPGDRCYVYELYNMGEVEKRGVNLFEWTDWPLREAAELIMPDKGVKYIFTYNPANWCAVGDPGSKEAMFFVSSPIQYDTRTDIMKMGIFMTDKAYVVQPCLSYALQGANHIWRKPEAITQLAPGEHCKFTVDMVVYGDVFRNDVEKAFNVFPGCVLLDEPRAKLRSGNLTLNGRIAFAGSGTLTVTSGDETIKSQDVKAGLYDLKKIGAIPCVAGKAVKMMLKDESGSIELCAFESQYFQPSSANGKYRRRITVDKTMVVSGNLTGFPVQIAFKDDALKSLANGGHVMDDKAQDICFVTADAKELLPYEIEKYDPVSGEFKALVRLPKVMSSEDTVFYMYYGGKSKSQAKAAEGRVWDTGMKKIIRPKSKDAVVLQNDRNLKFRNQITVEALVESTDGRAEGMQSIVSMWKPLDSFDTFDAYDAGNTSGLDTSGFLGAVFDGRYLYFSPQHDAETRHGKVLRYDTHGGFHDSASWKGYDASASSGLETKGYYGAVFDGLYVYFVPRRTPKEYHTRVLRYNTRMPFENSKSWTAFDTGIGISYQGGGFDGRYVYFAPGSVDKNSPHYDKANKGRDSGLVLRYDTQKPFDRKSSYETFNAGNTGGLRTRDFDGVVFDGQYVYFVPLSFSAVLRYNTKGKFTDQASWEAFDATPLGMKRNVGSVFDGRYIYFATYNGKHIIRYDVNKPFVKGESWSAYDVTKTSGAKRAGYDGGFFDGRYVYFVPFIDFTRRENNKKMVFHSEIIRYDTQKDFNAPQSWKVTDAEKTSGLHTVGYNAGAFDGRYFYFAPWHDGSAYEKEGKIVGHGRVLRYDTLGDNGTFSLRYCDYGHNGGLSGSVPGPRFLVNTDKGAMSIAANEVLGAGRHYIVGVYDGDRIRLFIDGMLANEQSAKGKIVNSKTGLAIGRVQDGLGYFGGRIFEVRISDVARSAEWIRTQAKSILTPNAFCRVGEEK